MKYNVLHNFISPVTGRILADDGYVLVGDSNGFATSSPALIDLRLDLIHLRQDYNILSSASIIMGFPNSEAPNAQVLSKLANGVLYNTAGIVSTINVIPASADAKYILQTANSGLPNAQALDSITSTLIAGGNILKSDSNGVVYIASGGATVGIDDYVTPFAFQSEVSALESQIAAAEAAAIAASIANFDLEMLPYSILPGTGLQIAASIASTLAVATGAATAAGVANTDIGHLKDINFIIGNQNPSFVLPNAQVLGEKPNGFLYNTAGTVSLIDISSINVPIELQGDVTGSGVTGIPIQTTLQLTLDEIKIAQDTVNLNNNRIKNLVQSPVEDFDAVSFTFLWDLMHDEVEVLWP